MLFSVKYLSEILGVLPLLGLTMISGLYQVEKHKVSHSRTVLEEQAYSKLQSL